MISKKAVSIRTVIADPIPEELISLQLTDDEGDGLCQGLYKWDENLRKIITVEVLGINN
jgi:hypothetical protein